MKLKQYYNEGDTDLYAQTPPDQILGENLLIHYLNMLKSDVNQHKFRLLVNFFGISIPFCAKGYKRNMEFAVWKQSMGRANDKFFEKQVKTVFRRWQHRWLVVGYNSLFYYEYPEDPPHSVRDSIPFDNDMTLDVQHIGSHSVTAIITISRRKLKLKIDRQMNGLICLDYIVKALRKSCYTGINRFNSFAPVRENNDCTFFADGVGYFKELYESLNKAQNEIMITDWWLAPEFPLLRPIKGDLEKEESRLDFTLKRAAERGVRIYALVYKEFSLGLNTDSEHAKNRLESLHQNIKVLRHPNVIISLWSHHEKMVIIDKRKVFMGGLDLCWNRMDGNNHPLFNNVSKTLFPGVDYGNPLSKEIAKSREYQVSMIKDSEPRMPWHDVACMLVGKICNDFVMHFSAYWNHAKESNYESEVLIPKKFQNEVSERQQSIPGPEPANLNYYQDGTIAGLNRYSPDLRTRFDTYEGIRPMPTNLEQIPSNTRSSPQKNMKPHTLQYNELNPYGNTYFPGTGQQSGLHWHHPGYSMLPYYHLHERGNQTLFGRNVKHGTQLNPFSLLSGKIAPEDYSSLFYKVHSVEDTSRWKKWLMKNESNLRKDKDKSQRANDSQNLNMFLTGYNMVSHPIGFHKLNRMLEDKDEQSKIL